MKHHKQRNILILLVVAALLVVSAFYIYPSGKKTHLGLDLQGGLEIVYKAALPNGTEPTRAQLDQTIGIINRRVNGLGVTEAAVQIQGADQISVALPGIKNVDQAVRTVGQTAQLQFFNDGKQRVSGPSDSLAAAVKQAKTQPLIAAAGGRQGRARQARQGRDVDQVPRRRRRSRASTATTTDAALLRLHAAAGHDRQRHHRARARASTSRTAPERADQLHRQGRQAVRRHHPRARHHRPDHRRQPDLRHRARQPDGVRPLRRLQAEPRRHPGHQRRDRPAASPSSRPKTSPW